MVKTKRIAILSAIMAVIMLMVPILSISVSAATGKSKTFNATQSKTITITTSKSGSPYITFESIGTGSYQYGAKAPILNLKVYNHKNGTTQYYRVTGSRIFNSVSSKLKLNPNTKYTVTVSYIYDKKLNWGTYGSGMYETTGWYNGQWRITSTKNLSYSFT